MSHNFKVVGFFYNAQREGLFLPSLGVDITIWFLQIFAKMNYLFLLHRLRITKMSKFQ